MKDWQGDRGRFRTPNIPYATYLEDGTRNLGVKQSIVRENLLEDERGGTGLDGIFLWVSDRGVLRRHYLDLPGSEVGSGSAPYVGLWFDEPRLYYGWIGDAYPDSGSVVAGDKVITRDLTA